MRFLFLFVYVLWTSASVAAVYDESTGAEFDRLVTRGGFYRPENVPLHPQNFERAARASVRLPAGGTCSAVILSNDGYVATALHCIQDCLKDAWDYKPDVKLSRFVSDGVYKVLGIHEQSAPRMDCPAMHGPDYWIWDYGLSDAKVVWIGSGMLNNNESRLADIPADEFAKIKNLNEDVVILKYNHRETASLPCVPTVKEVVPAGKPVWAIGFPVRGPGFEQSGYNEFVSLGRVRASIEEDPILQNYAVQIVPDKVQTFWNYQKELWNKESMLLTSVDTAFGNSGGMIIDQRGELAAILFTIMKSAPQYNASTVVGVSLPYIKRQMREALGEAAVAEVFKCEEPSRPLHAVNY